MIINVNFRKVWFRKPNIDLSFVQFLTLEMKLCSDVYLYWILVEIKPKVSSDSFLDSSQKLVKSCALHKNYPLNLSAIESEY